MSPTPILNHLEAIADWGIPVNLLFIDL